MFRLLRQRLSGLSSPGAPVHTDALTVEAFLCKAFQVSSVRSLQELINSLLLSECVYKCISEGEAKATQALSDLQQQFPPQLVSLHQVQYAKTHVAHRYMLAASENSIFVSCAGTKFPQDLLVDATFIEELVWREKPLASATQRQAPTAHRGFLQRAAAVPIEWLYESALEQKKNLIMCGHSLGGAVAALSTLRLLRQLPKEHTPCIKCICFGTPAIGNAALAQLVRKSGWDPLFHSVELPGDIIPGLWALQATPAEAEAVARQLQSPEVDTDSPTPPASVSQQARDAAAPAGPGNPPPSISQQSLHGQQPATPAEQLSTVTAQGHVSAPSISAAQAPGSGPSDAARSSAASSASPSRLQQLESLARAAGSRVSAAGSRVTAVARFWPGFVHFGQHHVWDPAPEQPLPPPSALQVMRSTLTLAAHRMPAYRAQAVLICAASGAQRLPEASWSDIHEGPVLPALHARQVHAQMGPLPLVQPGPASAKGASRSRPWPWLPGVLQWQPRVQQPALQPTVQVHIVAAGQELRGATAMRLLVPTAPSGDFASPWLPVTPPAPLAAVQPQPQIQQRRRWLAACRQQQQQQQPGSAHGRLLGSLFVPDTVVRHVLGGTGSMQLHCRSDLGSCKVPAVPRWPVAWLVQCSMGTPSWTRTLQNWMAIAFSGLHHLSGTDSSPDRQQLPDGIILVQPQRASRVTSLPDDAAWLASQLTVMQDHGAGRETLAADTLHSGSLPQLLIVDHLLGQTVPEPYRAALAQLGSACRCSGVPLLLRAIRSASSAELSDSGLQECAGLYGVAEKQLLQATQALAPGVTAPAGSGTTFSHLAESEAVQVQTAIHQMVLQGKSVEPLRSRL